MSALMPIALKIIACVIIMKFPFLKAVWVVSPILPLSWGLNNAGVELVDFKLGFGWVLYGAFFVLLAAPWIATSKKSGAAIVGLALVAGLNLTDIVTYTLSAAPAWVKAANLLLSTLMIGLSIWKARAEI